MKGVLSALLIAAAAPVTAQELRPAPDYFVNTVFGLTVAQALARSCSTVTLNPVAAQQASEALLIRLEEDGFDMTAPHEQMSGAQEAMDAARDAFMTRHGLVQPDETQVCAAATNEIAEATAVGLMLLEMDE